MDSLSCSITVKNLVTFSLEKATGKVTEQPKTVHDQMNALGCYSHESRTQRNQKNPSVRPSTDLKTAIWATVSWVRIPLPPPVLKLKLANPWMFLVVR